MVKGINGNMKPYFNPDDFGENIKKFAEQKIGPIFSEAKKETSGVKFVDHFTIEGANSKEEIEGISIKELREKAEEQLDKTLGDLDGTKEAKAADKKDGTEKADKAATEKPAEEAVVEEAVVEEPTDENKNIKGQTLADLKKKFAEAESEKTTSKDDPEKAPDKKPGAEKAEKSTIQKFAPNETKIEELARKIRNNTFKLERIIKRLNQMRGQMGSEKLKLEEMTKKLITEQKMLEEEYETLKEENETLEKLKELDKEATSKKSGNTPEPPGFQSAD